MAQIITTKLSIAKIVGKVLKALGEADEVALVRVYGTARDLKRGVSTYGTWVSFVGEFHGVNLVTRDTYTGCGELFVPECATNLIESAMLVSDDDGKLTGEINTIEVAFDISAKKSENSFGYEYIVKPLWDCKPSNNLQRIADLLPPLPEKKVCLPAPKVNDNSETPPLIKVLK